MPPLNINNLFGNWLNGVSKSEKINLRVGTCAILWAIWHVRNEFIFNKSHFSLFLQVIPLAIHWIRMWSYLQSAECRLDMDIGYNRLATVAGDIYSQFRGGVLIVASLLKCSGFLCRVVFLSG
jgi:hypothetical protein